MRVVVPSRDDREVEAGAVGPVLPRWSELATKEKALGIELELLQLNTATQRMQRTQRMTISVARHTCDSSMLLAVVLSPTMIVDAVR